MFQKYGDVVHSFSLNYRKSSVSFLISALIQELFKIELFSSSRFVGLLLFLSLLKICGWSDRIQGVISILSYLSRLALWPSLWSVLENGFWWPAWPLIQQGSCCPSWGIEIWWCVWPLIWRGWGSSGVQFVDLASGEVRGFCPVSTELALSLGFRVLVWVLVE